MTSHDPDHRPGDPSSPSDVRHTWCIASYDGEVYVDGRKQGVCRGWRRGFGYGHYLATGDTVSVCLGGDRSVSITVNHTQVRQVFTGLPHTPVWLGIHMLVNKIEIIQTGELVGSLVIAIQVYIGIDVYSG